MFQLVFSEDVWAWGPAIHTVIACRILDEVSQILPAISRIVQLFPLEYLYGSLAADFFVGKGEKKKDGLIHRASTWKRMGHLYWEAKADYFVGPVYMRIARDVLSMEQLGCDDLLKSAVQKSRNGLKARRHFFTQSVKVSDYLCSFQPMFQTNSRSRYRISPQYIAFMINLSYCLVRDFLCHPDSSPCLSYDPIGSQNLGLASQNTILSKLFRVPRPMCQFKVDQELLEI